MAEYSGEGLRSILDKDAHIFLDDVKVVVENNTELKAELTGTLIFPDKPPNYRFGETEPFITLGELGDIIHQARYLLYQGVTLGMLTESDDERIPKTYSKKGTKAHAENAIPRNTEGVPITLTHTFYRPINREHIVYYDLKIGEFIHEERTLRLGF